MSLPVRITLWVIIALMWVFILYMTFHRDKLTIKIKYFNNGMTKIKRCDVGDWIDLRSSETVRLREGQSQIIKLGVAMKLPEGYEAHIVPRSSTFKNYGIIQTNHMGVIDESYCGDEDEWGFPVYALRDTIIPANERICQFRIIKTQPHFEFVEVEHLQEKSRGGFGSTGVK